MVKVVKEQKTKKNFSKPPYKVPNTETCFETRKVSQRQVAKLDAALSQWGSTMCHSFVLGIVFGLRLFRFFFVLFSHFIVLTFLES